MSQASGSGLIQYWLYLVMSCLTQHSCGSEVLVALRPRQSAYSSPFLVPYVRKHLRISSTAGVQRT
jgi:hypothetical protein